MPKAIVEAPANAGKHTAGEWKVEQGQCNPLVVAETPDGPIAVADVLDDCYPDSSQQQANARLIAAAPDLLAACEYVNWWLRETGLDGTAYPSVVCLVRGAIAKATGGAP